MDGTTRKQIIMIVDDSPENITILGSLLREEYTLHIAINGEKALKLVESGHYPDLIILDIVMPGMDGYEVCRILKANIYTKNIPVIFITAKTCEEDEVRGFEMGAIDYITKPFSSVVVKARIRTQMELKKYRDFLVDTSYCDGLTAISNRRRFDEDYKNLWNSAIREAMPLSLIMIDIDHFKQFNDTYGHQEGDNALILIAKTLEASLKRETDVVARYGGEEFICMLPNTLIKGAINIGERLRTSILSLQIPHELSTVSEYVTISLGIAGVVPTQSMSYKALINNADECLYKAKHEGRNRLRYNIEEMEEV